MLPTRSSLTHLAKVAYITKNASAHYTRVCVASAKSQSLITRLFHTTKETALPDRFPRLRKWNQSVAEVRIRFLVKGIRSAHHKSLIRKKRVINSNFVCMDVVTGGRDCPINSNKHTLQLNSRRIFSFCGVKRKKWWRFDSPFCPSTSQKWILCMLRNSVVVFALSRTNKNFHIQRPLSYVKLEASVIIYQKIGTVLLLSASYHKKSHALLKCTLTSLKVGCVMNCYIPSVPSGW